MSKLIELTAVYDSTITSISEMKPAKVLVDVDAIQSVMKDWETPESDSWSRGQQVTLHPSFASYGENEHGEHAVLDQRTLIVRESYEAIRAIIDQERGVISAQTQ